MGNFAHSCTIMGLFLEAQRTLHLLVTSAQHSLDLQTQKAQLLLFTDKLLHYSSVLNLETETGQRHNAWAIDFMRMRMAHILEDRKQALKILPSLQRRIKASINQTDKLRQRSFRLYKSFQAIRDAYHCRQHVPAHSLFLVGNRDCLFMGGTPRHYGPPTSPGY